MAVVQAMNAKKPLICANCFAGAHSNCAQIVGLHWDGFDPVTFEVAGLVGPGESDCHCFLNAHDLST